MPLADARHDGTALGSLQRKAVQSYIWNTVNRSELSCLLNNTCLFSVLYFLSFVEFKSATFSPRVVLEREGVRERQ